MGTCGVVFVLLHVCESMCGGHINKKQHGVVAAGSVPMGESCWLWLCS